ncbi:DUF5320 domain-containing protein [Haliovirga abyssi]|uniref:DUF5320 domain-containing protein n=1 Tax=Haliovirga abyssi TaxID=2996794 RepID=A0AAU9D721_9FUSO|nr:DUF5320 domain-containing protein [Haliovirga abyssi]BDU50358.1 hypothetical protein HLVA_09270 [Haliovirga abyssi]
MRGNRRGPLNEGPMTGRGLGLCSGSETTGYVKEGGRLGLGLGRRNGAGMVGGFGRRGGNVGAGRGFGFRGRGYGYENYSAPAINETEYLKEEEKVLRANLDAISKRLEELEKNSK